MTGPAPRAANNLLQFHWHNPLAGDREVDAPWHVESRSNLYCVVLLAAPSTMFLLG